MDALDKEMAPQELTLPGTRPTDKGDTVDTRSLAHPAHPLTEECPCACLEGVVYIGHMVEEDGDEVEVVEAIPCRRCAGDHRVF